MSAEHYFEIRKEIGLGFFNGREQYDQLIKPSQGFLLFNGRDISWVLGGLKSPRIPEPIKSRVWGTV